MFAIDSVTAFQHLFLLFRSIFLFFISSVRVFNVFGVVVLFKNQFCHFWPKWPEIMFYKENTQFWDILDLPDPPDGDQNSWKHFLNTPMIPRITKRYHIWSYYDKIPIKTPQILQILSFWTFFNFLILMMVTKIPGNPS